MRQTAKAAPCSPAGLVEPAELPDLNLGAGKAGLPSGAKSAGAPSRFIGNAYRKLIAITLLGFAVWSGAAQAQTSPEVTRGLQWLIPQIQADGSLLNEPQSIATSLQNRTEAAQTLKLLATVPASLTAIIDAEPEDNTVYIARKVISLALNGWNTTNYANLLLTRQNVDGGFGGAANYSSGIPSTGWALLALAQANQTSSSAANRARTYLVGQLASDGGMPGRNIDNRMRASAITLLALQTTPDSSNANAIRGLASWLQLQQGSDGSWASDTYLTAFVLSAIAPVTADATVRNAARSFLLSQQLADGSWNDDPFLSALVLRVLSIQTSSTSTDSTLQGQVVDSATNAPLASVSVTLAGSANQTATTDATGKFSFGGLAAGSYVATYDRTGYSAKTASYIVYAGQNIDAGFVGLTQLLSGGIIRGQVTTNTNTPLSGVTIALSGAATMNTSTDANGQYEFLVASQGAFTIAASLSGYQTASATSTIAGGQTIVFSPVLYANSQTAPTTIRYLGKVVSAGTNAPLANVAIQIAGTANSTTNTTATGQFDVTMNPGSYTATFALAGYAPVTQTFVAPAGTIVDGGSVTLSPIKTTSSIAGKVVNGSNTGIAGASVQVVGTNTVASTAADGSYTIAGVVGTSFSLRASATGYDAQTVALQLAAPTDLLQNFTLAAQSAGDLAIGPLTVTPAMVGSNANVSVATTISNTGAADSSAVVQLLVSDVNQQLIGKGSAYDAGNNLIGQVNVAAGGQQNIRLQWNSAQFPPGEYVLDVRLVQAGSVTQATPQGTLLVERIGGVTVTEQLHFTGSIIANPPVLQAGTNTAIKLSALVQNDGNGDLPAQTYTLTVIDIKDGSIVTSQQVVGAASPVNGMQTLVYPDWTPATGGNFRLELAASDATLGKVLGSVYVGDAARASYTVNKIVVPTGTQTVRGTINVTGQDVTTGSISDPLAPLIKTAVNKAMAYNYPAAAYDTLSSRCLRCHVQSQALVGGELTRNLTNESDLRTNRDLLLNGLTTHLQSNGAIDGYGGYQKTQSMLGMWALNAWHNKGEILSTLAKGAGYLASVQNTNGSWDPDHASGWWSTQVANTAFNVKNLADIYAALAQAPASGAVNNALAPLSNQGISGPYGLASDTSGNVYASSYNNGTVRLIRPDGTSQAYLSGLSNPTALVFASDGTAYVSSYGGLYRRNADGTATQITSRRGSGLAIGPDGNLYMSSYWDNKISRITPAGVVSDYVVGGALSNPWGIAFSAAGDLLVASYGGQNILRYRADLSHDIPVGWTNGGVRNLQMIANGWMVTTDSGLYFYDSDWHAERLLYTPVGGVAVTPDGSVVVGDINTNTVSKLTATPIDAAALRAKMDMSISKGTTWLLQDSNTDSNNNLSLAQRLIGLNAAKQYYQGQPLAVTLQAKMVTVGAQLRSHVHADGGWGWTTGYTVSDSLVTAQVGFALDALNPSASDPIVQNAVHLLLSRQRTDGTWNSENGILSTPLAATTWVSIWLPIVLDRLGGVDTDLSVSFPANVTMTNPDLAPTSSTANSDGSKTAVWHLTGVTSAGRAINYDLTLQDMAIDEVRAVSTDAHLTFKNSFTGGVVNAPIDIPRVTASAFLGLGVTTDKLAYPADAIVNVTGQVTNTGATVLSGKVKFDIYAPDNTLVATLGTTPFNALPAGASVNLGMNWNVAKTLAGSGYYALGSLLDNADHLVGTAKASFAIVGADIGSTGLTASLATDKQLYQATETVKLADRISNVTLNLPLNNLTIVTTVNNPDGTVRFTQTETLPQLVQSSLKDYGYSVKLNAAPAGQYSATLVVTAADGTLLGQAATQFSVASSSATGNGLTGTLVAGPKQVPLGDIVVMSFSAKNGGNSVLTNLPLTVNIIDPALQTVIASFPYTSTLNVGAAYSASTSWQSTGLAGTTYVAVLSAVVGTNTLTLAQDTFTVIAPPIKLGITQKVANGNRVLVLVSCSDDESEINGNDGKPAVCVTQRSQTIDQALTALGIMHTITTNETAFKVAFRSGIYNTYWISGKQDKLHDDLTREIREAVFAGDGLILDGVHDQRNKMFDTVAGITYKGKVGETNLPVNLAAPLFTVQGLPTVGRALKLDLNGALQEAALAGHQPNSSGPGIVTHTYGAGHSILFAFDLVSSLQAQALWQPVLATSVQSVLPLQPATLIPAGLLPVQTTIVNQANATDVDVRSILPLGANYLSATPTASYDAATRTVDWTFNLAVAQSKDFSLLMEVPATAGDFNLQTIVSSVKNGTATPYGAPLTLAIHVTDAQQSATMAQTALNAFVLAANKDQKLRDSLVTQLQSAMMNFNKNTAAGDEAAIAALIQIIDQLSDLTTVDTRGVRDGLDRIIKEAQWRWTLAQPPASP